MIECKGLCENSSLQKKRVVERKAIVSTDDRHSVKKISPANFRTRAYIPNIVPHIEEASHPPSTHSIIKPALVQVSRTF
jgi:hypothetical protein